ncbi:PP0621 family protein [Marinospirillum perlucidum]|uniref:PP0621 family protein n=1 Tax=Marinospirillum perlucidum TaxID=1982602 RepID=UPI000DF2F4ED|nr:PP0621 family protein [Marinospirillum perlucidum]
MSLLIIRLLVFVLVFWAGWRLWQYWQQARPSEKTSDKDDPGPKMVKCQECGVHLPADEAIQSGDLHFCSIDHRDAYQSSSDKD